MKEVRAALSCDSFFMLDDTSSQSSQECSPPCHGGDRGFKSHRGRFQQVGAVRNPAKRRSSNLRDCLWVRLPPVLLVVLNENRRPRGRLFPES